MDIPDCTIDHYCLPQGSHEVHIELLDNPLSYEAIMQNYSVDTIADVYDVLRLIEKLSANRFRTVNNLRKARPYARFHIKGDIHETYELAQKIGLHRYNYRISGKHVPLCLEDRDRLTVIRTNGRAQALLSDKIGLSIYECAEYVRCLMQDIYSNNKSGIVEVVSG
jgi:hypothetical protein